MRRRTFLSAGASAGLVAAVTSPTPAAPVAPTWANGRKGPKVLIPATPPDKIAELKAVSPDAELVVCRDAAEAVRQAADADASYGFITREVLSAGKHLKWVQQPSAGVEGVVGLSELADSQAVLTNMQRVFGPPIADQAIGYLLAFTRGLNHFIRTNPAEDWSRPRDAVFEELQGKTMLIVGLGGIGSDIARRAHAFGMTVLATDPKVLDAPLPVRELHRPEAFRSLLPRADVLVSAAPLTAETRRMIGGPEFALMPRGRLLINVSRGGLVDTNALVTALSSGQLAGAGLDVTDPEPLPKGHPLWKQNVIVSPHTAGQSPGSDGRRQEVFKENLRRFTNGLMLVNVVDKKAGY